MDDYFWGNDDPEVLEENTEDNNEFTTDEEQQVQSDLDSESQNSDETIFTDTSDDIFGDQPNNNDNNVPRRRGPGRPRRFDDDELNELSNKAIHIFVDHDCTKNVATSFWEFINDNIDVINNVKARYGDLPKFNTILKQAKKSLPKPRLDLQVIDIRTNQIIVNENLHAFPLYMYHNLNYSTLSSESPGTFRSEIS